MRNTSVPALFVGVMAAGAAFGSAPAAARPQGHFGPGRDGDHQPPAYDRVGLGIVRSAGGGGGL